MDSNSSKTQRALGSHRPSWNTSVSLVPTTVQDPLRPGGHFPFIQAAVRLVGEEVDAAARRVCCPAPIDGFIVDEAASSKRNDELLIMIM